MGIQIAQALVEEAEPNLDNLLGSKNTKETHKTLPGFGLKRGQVNNSDFNLGPSCEA